MRHWEGQVRSKPLPEADPEHLERLKASLSHWNEWRAHQPEVVPSLYGANLRGRDLSGRDLTRARLDGADLTDATLRGVKLVDACLFEAVLERANLDKAEMIGANLADADLVSASASDAVLANVSAPGARFAGATIRDSQLGRADLRNTDLREAELQGSDLRQAKLAGAILWTTNLNDADLRGTSGVLLNETSTRNTKFSPRSPDRWSTLRRHYTGPRYAITLIFLVAFVLPYFAKAAGWVAAARTQETLRAAIGEARVGLSTMDQSDSVAAATEVLRHVHAELPQPGSDKWRAAQVWELLLGVDKGIWYFLSTCALIAYNLLRGFLTYVVGPMRDAEERSGVSPPHRGEGLTLAERFTHWIRGGWAESYAWLWLPHKTVTVLFALAFASFLFHAAHWLGIVVWLPVPAQ